MEESKKEQAENKQIKEEILQKLIERTAEALGVEPSTLNANTDFRSLGLKSLEMAGIIATFEDEYDAYIKYVDFMDATTMDDAAEIIAKSIEE